MFKRIIFFLLLLLPDLVNGQENNWPIKYRARYAQIAPTINGKIITIRNDTIVGIIKQLHGHFPILPNSNSTVLEINQDSVSKVILIGHSILKDSHTTELVNLGRSMGYWRIISENGQCGIYDNVLSAPTFVFGTKMILLVNKKRYKIYSTFSYVFHNGQIVPMLKRFIKRRFSKIDKIQNEESAENLIQLILQLERRENE